MFRTIVGAILFIEFGIPLIILLISYISEKSNIGCIIFGVVFWLLIIILL